MEDTNTQTKPPYQEMMEDASQATYQIKSNYEKSAEIARKEIEVASQWLQRLGEESKKDIESMQKLHDVLWKLQRTLVDGLRFSETIVEERARMSGEDVEWSKGSEKASI